MIPAMAAFESGQPNQRLRIAQREPRNVEVRSWCEVFVSPVRFESLSAHISAHWTTTHWPNR